jgi:hypothetical protein
MEMIILSSGHLYSISDVYVGLDSRESERETYGVQTRRVISVPCTLN